jgi:predicted nuclease of restriction endonuclease-like (RecB) superfamily
MPTLTNPLPNQLIVSATPEAYDAFLVRLDAPPTPNERLKKTMQTPAPWDEFPLPGGIFWLCLQMVDAFPDSEIVNTVCSQLSWSHLRLLLGFDDNLKRDFYIELCRMEGWSVRQLQERIKSMLYERTAISKKAEETIRHDLQALRHQNQLSQDLAFRDPYLLDFLGLADTYAEKDLEAAIVAELQRFIIELGSDFAFMARQRIMQKAAGDDV